MQVFLDEHCLVSYFPNILENLPSVEAMVDLMEYIVDAAPLQLFVPADFYSFDINGKSVGELIYTHYADSSIRDLLRRVEYIINAAELVPTGIEHGPTAVAGLRKSECGGIVTNTDYSTFDWWQPDRMFQLGNQTDVRIAVRTFFIVEKLPEADFYKYSTVMFESLHFHCPIENIKHVGLRFAQAIPDIVKHMSYLNDVVRVDFHESNDDRELSTRAGSHGVNMSPESNATRSDRSAMQQREVEVMGVPIVCEWHTKLTPTHGRIHFYPWVSNHPELAKSIGNKVIIGIICKHLG